MTTATAPPQSAMSPEMSAAWQRYLAGLEVIRERIYATDMEWRPETRAAAAYFLMQAQASAFNTCLAPKQSFPAFYVHTTFEPNIYTWTLPNPDFHYRWAFIDGRRTYRIWGQRGSTLWLDIQVMRSHWCDDDPEVIGNYDPDAVMNADGSFEYILSPDPQPGRNWIRLDPSSANNVVLVRDTHYDWENSTGAELHIALADDVPTGPCFLSEEEIARRLDGCLRMLHFVLDHFQPHITSIPQRNGFNRFYRSTVNTTGGSNPVAVYMLMPYEIAEDEVLLLEFRVPDTMYWNIHLGDVWGGTADYTLHQSCLNGAQAHVDADGICRMVLSVEDPGVPNWLDAIGCLHGLAQMRYYKTEAVVVPHVTKLRMRDLRQSLPDDHPVHDRAQRRRDLAARQDAVRRRYHY